MLTGSALETVLRRYGIELVTRAQAGLRPWDCRSSMPTPSPRFYDHHAAIESSDDAQEWRGHQAYHMDHNGWCDIAYNFGIPDPATGNFVYEGRGVGVQGGHTQGENTESHAFCVMGNFERDKPAAATLELAAKLMAAGIKERWWANTILGHRDAPGATTSCPGRFWYEQLPWLRARVNQILAGPTPPPPPPADLGGLDMALTFYFGVQGDAKRPTLLWDGGVVVDRPSALVPGIDTLFDEMYAANRGKTGKIPRKYTTPALYDWLREVGQSHTDDAPGTFVTAPNGEQFFLLASGEGMYARNGAGGVYDLYKFTMGLGRFNTTPVPVSQAIIDDLPVLNP